MPSLIPSLLRTFFFCTQGQVIRVTTSGTRQLASSHRRERATIAATERQKWPTQGGQNLSDRYRRLEKSVRGKEALLKSIDALPPTPTPSAGSRYPPTRTNTNTFRGFKIPEEPKEPQADECCMSGCAICVYDLYQESLVAYKESLATLRTSLQALDIPESAWPSSVHTSPTGANSKHGSDVSSSAFEDLERAIKERNAGNTGR